MVRLTVSEPWEMAEREGLQNESTRRPRTGRGQVDLVNL